ncbi:MAG: substrate-binding domain-containing protein [Candidatus Binatia bacterium]
MSTAHAVMGLLARGERYGYEIRGELEAEFGSEWRIDFGQLYRLLASIRREGWVAVRVEPGKQGPDRRVYAITRRGRAELKRWLRGPVITSEHGRDEFPLKVRFGMASGPVYIAALIAERRRILEARRRAHEDRSEAAQRKRDAGAWLLAEGHKRHTETALSWLRSCEAVIPARHASPRAPIEAAALVAVGSDDLVLDLLVRLAAEQHPEIRFSTSPSGSIAGLIALREQRAHVAGVHLLDVDSGAYNIPFVKHVLPEEPIILIHLAQREQGLMVAAGNPKGIRHLRDLTRSGVRIINRQRGAGTRVLLHHRLRQAKIDPQAIAGYEREAPTHNAVAAAITAGSADVGLGIRAVAQAWGLEFISLGYERYELAIARPVFDSVRLRPLLGVMHQDAFRRKAAALSGYDISRMSEVVAEFH